LVLLKDENQSGKQFLKSIADNLGSISKIVVAGKSRDDIGNLCGGWTISWQGSSGDITPGTTVLEAVQAFVDDYNTANPSNTITVEDKGDRGSGNYDGDIGIVGK
jgi:beta-glucosidase